MPSTSRANSSAPRSRSPSGSPTIKKDSRLGSGRPLSSLPVNSRGGASSLPPRSPTSPVFSTSHGGSPVNAGGEAVHVAVRCRPPMRGEREEEVIVSMDTQKKEVYLKGESQVWKVDVPLWSGAGSTKDGKESVSQADLYRQVGRPLLLHALEGYNSTMMAYGQTGSGKTYTMMGSYKDPRDTEAGLIPRICRDLFTELRDRSFTAPSGESFSWEVHVRYIEVYCEKISDLLNNNAPVGIREEVTPESATFALLGAHSVKANSSEDLLRALVLGNKSRHTASTKANERSSRSHAIFIIELTELLSFEEPDGTVASAPSKSLSIRLVDLAGSERVSETGVQGQQLKEARDINRSLFTLGQVIESLTDSRRQIKPPYRDSVLTKILRDAFGGNSKTTMVCAVSPMETHRVQTLQTLSYASKARRVVNKPVIEEDPSAVELRRANEELVNLRRELSDAKRSGQKYDSIEEQLREALEKLKRDQLEMREKKSIMEKREADLANRLREVDQKKDEYEAQMAALESEVELAKKQQEARERELRKAYANADKVAKTRLDQLQQQRDASERALRAKEEELLTQQHIVEERLAELEVSSRNRVEELQRRQRDLEEELRLREKAAVKREEELRKKTEMAEEQARQLSQRTHLLEREWHDKVLEMEQKAQEREQEIRQQAESAQTRLRALEEEARQKEEEMRKKRAEVELQARTLESELEAKQMELDRRILELHLQAEKRESLLNEKLQKAEFELKKKERESLESREALDALKETSAKESALSRSRELDLSTQHAKMAEAFSKRELALKKREEELSAQFEELLSAKRQWEEEYRKKEEDLRVNHDESLAILRGRETYLKQKQSELLQQEEEIESKLRSLEMETQRRELELEARRNDFEAQMQREQHAGLRTREELQLLLDRQETEIRLKEDKLNRWEEDLLTRRSEVEKGFQKREIALRQRESMAAIAEDRATAKEAQAEKLLKRLEHERRELFDRSINEAEANRKEYNSMIITLKRQQREIDQLRRASSEESTYSNRSPPRTEEMEQIVTAQKALFKREIFSLLAFESLYRGSIIVEEDTEFRTMLKENQLGIRDVNRVIEIKNQMGELSHIRHEADLANQEHSKAQERVRNYQGEIDHLKEELSRCMDESAQLRLQLSMTTSIARDAEDSLQRVVKDIDISRVQGEMVERDLRASLSEAHSACVDEMRRANRFARGLYNLLDEQEERERGILEYQYTREMMWIRGIEISERKGVERLDAIGKWESLYEERSAIALGDEVKARAVDANASLLHDQLVQQSKLYDLKEGLSADQVSLQHRIDEFEAFQRSRLRLYAEHDDMIKQYLIEIEMMDRERTSKYREREKQLADLALQLNDKEKLTGDQLQGICKALFSLSSQPNYPGVPRHIMDQDGRYRRERMEREVELCDRALQGDRGALEELKRFQKECIAMEAEILESRMNMADEEEVKRRRRWKEQEEQILQYLLLLEQEDIRRGKRTKEEDELFREAEERLRKSKIKENNLRDLARRLQLEALALEEQSRLMESNLQARERDLANLRVKRDEVESRRAVANSQIDDSERTLLDLEADLLALLNKNKDTKQIIKARDAELKRQRLFYLDLTKLLEERERMLREEHDHRMRGKKNANWLARDLLDYNDKLKKYVRTTRQRWHTLLFEDLLECDLCNWKNGRDLKFCKCCGHDLLKGDPAIEDTSLL